MSEQQGDVRNITIPRKAVFKVKGTTAGVIEKRELISYPANALSQNLTVGETDSSGARAPVPLPTVNLFVAVPAIKVTFVLFRICARVFLTAWSTVVAVYAGG